jgi:hypothetical protein
MSLDVNTSFNSALINSGNTFQYSVDDLQNWTHCHSLSDNGTLEVLTLSLSGSYLAGYYCMDCKVPEHFSVPNVINSSCAG